MKKIHILIFVLKHLFNSLRFNFYYLPFRQAIKLPFIFECRAKFIKLKGKIVLDEKELYTGMIRFKSRNVGVYNPNSIFLWENYGTIVFKGRGTFKAGSAVSVGRNGILTFGNNFSIGPYNYIVCLEEVNIGENFLGAWEVIILDSDFHHTYNLEKNKLSVKTKPIKIGNNCWIGTRTMIYKGTEIPNNTIVGGMSVLNKKFDIPSYCLLAGNPVEIKATNVVRLLDDVISQEEINQHIITFMNR